MNQTLHLVEHLNRLLARLPTQTLEKLSLQDVDLPAGKHLVTPEELSAWVYFPHAGTMISLTRSTAEGANVEVGIVGWEGLVPVHAVLASVPLSSDAAVQISGLASRAPLREVQQCIEEHRAFREALLRYSAVLFDQVSQNAVCNGLHRVEQRLARWLLMVRDRIRHDTLELKHEFIAQMLGVRRPGVSTIIHEFANQGLVETSRGSVTIRDVEGLERRACECYEVFNRSLSQLD